VKAYADLCGDHNPVHLDAAFAATTRFRGAIAHGMLFGGLFGTIFGVTVPGSIYVSQSFKFRKPVYVDEPIIARIEVVEVKRAPLHLATCRTTVRKAKDGVVALDGEAVVLLPTGADAAAAAAAAEAAAAALREAAPLK
jgi:acyl dehydratase